MRFAFLRFLRKNVFKVPEGAIAPKLLKFIYYTLFPFNWLYERQSNINYKVETDVYTIRGMRFTGELFYYFKSLASKGTVFQFINVSDNCTLRTLCLDDLEKEWVHLPKTKPHLIGISFENFLIKKITNRL